MSDTFYDVLGVSPEATESEIEAAYRERIKETHPDHSDATDAAEATKRVIEARDVLTDDRERARYDRLGHESYVAGGMPTADDQDVSDAASTARDADDGGPTNARAGPSERRRRERAAEEAVDWGVADSGSDRGRTRGRSDASGAARNTASATGGVASGRTATGADSFWEQTGSPTGGYTVRPGEEPGLRERLIPTGESLTLFGLAVLLYPIMLFSALFPPFPLVVNVVVGICTVLLVGYLQSRPGVGTVVFGVWSLLTTLALLVAGVEVASLVGVVALSGTWLPLGLSALTLWLIRP